MKFIQLTVVLGTFNLLCHELVASQPCAAGNYIAEGGECLQCPLGFYQPLPEQNGCLKCSETSITPTAGALSCEECAQNQVATANKDRCVCKPGFNPVYGTPDGTELTPQSCEPCAPGLYQFRVPHLGISICRPCDANSFTAEEGSTECTACPSGQSAPSGSSTCYECARDELFVNEKCSKCAPGFGYDQFSGQCTACRPGFYKNVEGNFPCLPCAKFTASAEGATECFEPCTQGETLISSNVNGDDVRCGKCAPGMHLDTTYSPPICSLCSQNQFMPYENTRSRCFQCAGDKVGATARGATECVCREALVNGSCHVCQYSTQDLYY